jgi:UrcA family protein
MLKIVSAVGAVVAASTLLLSTASLAGTVINTSDDGQVSARVSYGDLNLARTAGANALRGRIKMAAQQVCGFPRPVELEAVQESRECVAAAMASAQPAFDQALADAGNSSATVAGASLVVAAPRR